MVQNWTERTKDQVWDVKALHAELVMSGLQISRWSASRLTWARPMRWLLSISSSRSRQPSWQQSASMHMRAVQQAA